MQFKVTDQRRQMGRLLTVRSQATAQQKQTAVCLIETTRSCSL